MTLTHILLSPECFSGQISSVWKWKQSSAPFSIVSTPQQVSLQWSTEPLLDVDQLLYGRTHNKLQYISPNRHTDFVQLF